MKDGTAKKIKEIENYYQKRKEEITKQETEFKKKNKEAGRKEELTDAQSNALAEARSLAEKDYNKKLDEVNKEALTSMRDYLKEYGSLYQQKQAIAEEYEEKIAQAQTEGEKKSLMKQKEKALSNFDYESITMGIDWKGLMSGVGNMSKEMLKPMYDKLEAYTKTSEYQKAGSETQQKVVDLLSEMRSYLGTDQGATWQELAETIEEFHKAVSDYQKALNKEQVAQVNVKSAKLRLDNKEITQKEYEAILQTANEVGEGVVSAKNKMDTLGVNINSQTEAVKNYTSGLTAALNKLEAWKDAEGFSQVQGSVSSIDAFKGEIDAILPTLSEGMKKNIGSAVSSALGSVLNSVGNTVTNLLGGLIGSIAKIPSLILNLADSIKNFVTGILNSFSKLLKFEWLSDLVNRILEAVGNLIDTILDLPENLWHAISSIVVQGVGGLLNTVVGRIGNIVTLGALSSDGPASWFTNSNEKKVTEAIEDLTDRNELLQNSIEDLTSAMEDAYGSKATSYYEQAYKNQEESNRNYLEIAKAQAGYHSAHHSWNKDWNGFTSDELAWIKQNVKSDFNGDLFSLSPEEMKLLRGNVEIWERIQNTGEYGDRLTEKLDDYIDQAGKLEELTDKMKESLTQVSFDSMKESFISNLMDMTTSAEDFTDDFAEMMQKALLSYSMEDLINGDLKELYNDWSQAIKDSDGQLTDAQINELNNRYDAIVEEGLKRRDQWSKVTGYTGSSSQSASSGSWDSMGQDTAEDLNGRFTALQIAGESIAQNMESTISHMESIVSLGTSTNGAVLEIRNMMIMTNSYLEDMVKYAKLTYNDFGSKIDNINKRLKEI